METEGFFMHASHTFVVLYQLNVLTCHHNSVMLLFRYSYLNNQGLFSGRNYNDHFLSTAYFAGQG
jgi:hypothetical protein